MRTGREVKNKSVSKSGNGIRLKAWLNCSGISLGAADKQTDKICKPFASVYWSMSKRKYVLKIDKDVCEEYGIEPAQTGRWKE